MTFSGPQGFVGGELSPKMFGRPDDPKYQQGAALLRNFLVEPSGALMRRPGTEFVREVRNSTVKCRLVTFQGSGGEGIAVELGPRPEFAGGFTPPGYARFHRLGQSVLHSAAWDSATAYVVGDLVRQGGQLFACRFAHTNQTPPNSTYWETLEYVSNKPFAPADVSVAGDSIDFGVNHNMEDNEPIEFTRDGGVGTFMQTAAGDLRFGYVAVVNATTIGVRSTPGGPSLDITNAGTASHRMHRTYTAGELASQSGFVFYCRTSRPIDGSDLSIPPNASNAKYWYLDPSTGEYEIPTTLTMVGSDLFDVTHSQDENVLSFAHRRAFVSELPAISPDALISYTRFGWNQTVFVPPLSPPTGVAVAATKRGVTINITAVANNAGSVRITTEGDHHLVPGIDNVLIEGTGRPELDDKFFRVQGSAATIDPVSLETGSFVPFVAVAAAGKVRSTTPNSVNTNSYVVTSLDADGRESLASSVVSVVNNLFVDGAFNTVSWNAVVGADRYRIYKLRADSGLYGFIGQSSATSFRDDSIAPDIGQTPPNVDTSLASAPDSVTLPPGVSTTQPRAVTHFEGRRGFGGSDSARQDVWFTRSNTESDLTYGIPLKATDRIQRRLKASSSCTIRHLLSSAGQLLALTDTCVIRCSPSNTDALTPDSFVAREQSSVGASSAQPVTMANAGLFAGIDGHVYAVGFQNEEGGFVTVDQCERATHLFDGGSVVQMARQTAPFPFCWVIGPDGMARVLTFVPRQQVNAWHRQTAGNGLIESACVCREGAEERVYMIVNRTINGQTKRYIERTAPMTPVDWADSVFVDCAVTLTGAMSSVTGAGHLEGQTVQVFVDGFRQSDKVVVGGAFALDTPSTSRVTYGLANPAEMQTVPATFAMPGLGTGITKNVSNVIVRVEASGPFEIGIVGDSQEPVVPTEFVDGQPFSGPVRVRLPAEWTQDGRLYIRATGPTPLNIISITPDFAEGG